MKFSLAPRSAQSLAGAPIQNRIQGLSAAPYLRATLLGALVVLGSAGTALAQDAPTVKAKQPNAQSLWVTIDNPAQQRMQLRVVSLSTNNCLVNEVNSQPSYGTQLNFRNLPAGKYAVLLRVGQERYRYNVQVESQTQTIISVPGLTVPNASEAVASVVR
ncbi:hypothetical protein I2I05_06045 [Hymenobacter sp. BT683]|uniref:Uncharacterized protein n=1 Tax=Hymenobacter jeongseonensis TaxID=2791027 RepID=A0ABS0IF18_9BACT|nr:hypothetical protein [Hymenobacter jeongseonensis]MBF9236951.1 hypothetical protein [Hymenobacter jeongseonensis]